MIGSDLSNEKHRTHKPKTFAPEMEVIRHAYTGNLEPQEDQTKSENKSVILKVYC